MGATNSTQQQQQNITSKSRSVTDDQNRKIRALSNYWSKTGRNQRETMPGGYDFRFNNEDPNDARITLADSTDWNAFLNQVDDNYNQYVAPLDAYKNDARFKSASEKAKRIKKLAIKRGKKYDPTFDGDFSDPTSWYTKADLDKALATVDSTYDDYFGSGATGSADQRLSDKYKRKARRIYEATKNSKFKMDDDNDPDSGLLTSQQEKQDFEKDIDKQYQYVPTYDSDVGFNNVGKFAGQSINADVAANFGYQWNDKGPRQYDTKASVVPNSNTTTTTTTTSTAFG